MRDLLTPLDYRYLNMDEKKFYPSAEKLLESLQGKMCMSKTLTDYEHNQVLYAAGSQPFGRTEARMTCQQLTGVLKTP